MILAIRKLWIDSIQEFDQPSSLWGKANNNFLPRITMFQFRVCTIQRGVSCQCVCEKREREWGKEGLNESMH